MSRGHSEARSAELFPSARFRVLADRHFELFLELSIPLFQDPPLSFCSTVLVAPIEPPAMKLLDEVEALIRQVRVSKFRKEFRPAGIWVGNHLVGSQELGELRKTAPDHLIGDGSKPGIAVSPLDVELPFKACNPEVLRWTEMFRLLQG
jgi:hypothetical protein